MSNSFILMRYYIIVTLIRSVVLYYVILSTLNYYSQTQSSNTCHPGLYVIFSVRYLLWELIT